jgi:hypothetical protein
VIPPASLQSATTRRQVRVTNPFPRRNRVVCAVLSTMAAIAVSGCLPSVTDSPGVTPVEGRWDLSGQSASGSIGAFQGTLVLRSNSASSFSGTYDVVEGTGQGPQRRMSGPLGGRMASTSTTEFDVNLNGNTRRHVASQTADTLRGSWFDVTMAGTVEASGSFRAIRRP